MLVFLGVRNALSNSSDFFLLPAQSCAFKA